MANRGCGCKSPTNTRFTPTGYFEQSFDGGLTWERLTDDPRFNAPIFPPLVGPIVGTVPCAGAKSATEVVRLAIAKFKTDADAWESVLGLITVLIGFLVALIGPAAVVIGGIITALAFILFNFTQAAFLSHDFDPALALYKCIIFCNIESDASFTEAGWQQVKQDIVDQMSGLDETWFWNWANSLGPAGLTNSARVFASLAGDCSECGCGECQDPVIMPGQPGTNLHARPDLGAGWWEVTTTFVDVPSTAQYFGVVSVGCCLHVEYTTEPGLPNASPGNRRSVYCDGVTTDDFNYGVGQCVQDIHFRSAVAGNFQFHLAECP